VGGTADNIVAAGGNDSIEAGAGNDVLDGGTGDDAMAGGTGDDTYYVDSAGDGITELPGEGTDTVIAEVDYTLPEEVEALQLVGFARSGTGNTAANTITGTSGNDRLDGAAGADTLVGGLGGDTYVVDDAGDTVQEAPGGGLDTIESAIDLVLPANVEALELTGAARNGTGNGLANTLTGTAFDDTLDGGAGADAMVGGAGDDTYLVDAVGDSVIEAAGGGHDTVRSTIDLTLGALEQNPFNSARILLR
jgi:Ca2+-binding RTX toxin-like protein